MKIHHSNSRKSIYHKHLNKKKVSGNQKPYLSYTGFEPVTHALKVLSVQLIKITLPIVYEISTCILMYYLLLVKLNGFEYHPLVWVYYPIHYPIRYSKYRSLIAVRSSRTSYRFRSLHFSCSNKRSFPKRQQTECSLISLHFVSLHSFTHCLHLLAGSQGGLCESGARSNTSTVSCSRSKSGRRKAKKQSICHTFRFVHLPVSASEPIVAVSTLFVEAAKSLPRAVNWS